jgi:hypothetical protein
MSKKKRMLPQAVFIACEGRSTEKNYFRMIGEMFGDELNYALTVYPDEDEAKPKSDPLGLIHEAIRRKDEGFDELWAVFDKDGYTKHEDAFKLAKENDVRIAFSGIAFEEWVLLHFGRFSASFNKSDCKDANRKYIECGSHKQSGDCSGTRCVAGYMREHNLFPDYSKSSDRSIYPFLRNKTNDAIHNSAWLRYVMREEIRQAGERIYVLNPYTDVDLLVKRLTGYDKNHHYFNIDEIIENELFHARIQIPFPNLIIVAVTPKDGPTTVINDTNLNEWFSIVSNHKSYPVRLSETYLMIPGKETVINIDMVNGLDAEVEIIFKWRSNDLYHILRE